MGFATAQALAMGVALALFWGLPNAHAQNETILSRSMDEQVFGADDCLRDDTVGLNYVITATQIFPYYLARVESVPYSVSTNPCPLIPSASGEVVIPETEFRTMEGQLAIDFEATPSELMGEEACSTAGRAQSRFLCLYVINNGFEVVSDPNPFIIEYDTQAPNPVEILTLSPGDTRVEITVGGNEDSVEDLSYEVAFRRCDSGDGGDLDGGMAEENVDADGGMEDTGDDDVSVCGASGAWSDGGTYSGSTFTVQGLKNDITYEFRVRAVDNSENASEWSLPASAMPRPQLGVLDLYDGTPNPLSCSCQGLQPADAFFLFGFLALFLWRRPRSARGKGGPLRASLGATLLLATGALVVGGAPAAAWPGQVSVGAQAGPYQPAIDDETRNGESIFPIYDCFFDSQTLPMVGLDADVHLFDRFGSLRLGMGLAMAQATGQAQRVGGAEAGCNDPSSGSVALSMMHVRPGLTYAFDPFIDDPGIPLVPYARLGLVGMGYLFSMDSGFDVRGQEEGHNPAGWRLGWEAAGGLAFVLDFLEPPVARRARAQGIYEHAYLRAELGLSQVDSFGADGFVFSPRDSIFGTGLPLFARFGLAVELP
jgi:hypothetical protein